MVRIVMVVSAFIVICMGGYGLYAGMSTQYKMVLFGFMGVMFIAQFIGVYQRMQKLDEMIGKKGSQK